MFVPHMLTLHLKNHAATLLDDGMVLITGGADDGGTVQSSAELYDPATGVTTRLSSTLTVARMGHTATLLDDGRVLIAGGTGVSTTVLTSAEIYTPSTRTFALNPASMSSARTFHSATVLQDGVVLLAGGSNGSIALTNGEIFNPSSLAFVGVTNNMPQGRQNHTATRLTDGTVLIAGGSSGGTPTNLADLYRPSSNTFASTGAMVDSRSSHTATLLDDGTVLVCGGASGPVPMFATNALPSAEIFSITTHRFTQLDVSMSVPRVKHTATLLQDGTVLVAGGIDDTLTPLASTDIYDPVAKTFTATAATMGVARSLHTATALLDGTVFLAGGATAASDIAQADLFDPTPGAFVPSGPMLDPRQFHTATLLPDARALVAGGQNAVLGALRSTELYDGATYSAGPALGVARSLHTATPFTNGGTKQVLITGGVTAAASGFVNATADLYTPQAGAGGSVVPTTNTMSDSRFGQTATLLSNGNILVAGGEDALGQVTNTTDLFVPDGAGNGSFNVSRALVKTKNTMAATRVYHTATTLCDGSVMVAGGRDQNNNYLSSVEIYTPATDSFGGTKGGPKGGVMLMPRAFHTATLLFDCSVLLAGGVNNKGTLSAAEIYRPLAGKSIAVQSMNSARNLHTATFLPDGTVMLAGGESGVSAVVDSGEIYDPFLRIVTPAVGPMLSGRRGHAAVALSSGFVLLTGGVDETFAVTASSELYDPPSGPRAGGAIVIPSPAAKRGRPGQRVKAGSIRISNMSNLLETVTNATVALGDPFVFSSITMTRRSGGEPTRTGVDFPGVSVQFSFNPPIQLGPGSTVELKLEGRLAKYQRGRLSSQKLTGLTVTDWLGAAVSLDLPVDLGSVSER
jgi:N-acetylneuraminic acid mutarotase